jgi:hypothetical protein
VIIPNSINGEGLERLQRAIQSIPLIGGFSPDFVCIDGVSTIESYAFEGCTSLTRVTFLGPAIYDHRYYELEWVTDIIVQLYPMSTGDAVVDKFIDIIKSAYDPSTGDYNLGFYDNAFPQGSGSIFGSSGNALKDAYIGSDLKGTAGTYIRTAGGSYWSRQ